MKVELTFTEPLLGTLAGNKEIAKEFIASKHPQEAQADELEVIDSLDEALEKGSTVFCRDKEGRLFLWDYQVKGFFKGACEAMLDAEEYTQETLKRVRLTRYSYKRTLDNLLFTSPRKIYFDTSAADGECELVTNGFCQRPLRADTQKGERVALACSEASAAGTKIVFEVNVLNPKLMEFVVKWLDYGALKGMGQWRNSGMGRFTWREIPE